jgi:hypothetical protein
VITYPELINKLKSIKEMGYVKTHRSGNTGIGKTLEDLLGIIENNVPGPNAAMLELKSVRKNASSMLTLFTKSPHPPKVNSQIRTHYGYASSWGGEKRELHTTVNAVEFNQIKGKLGLKISIREDRIELVDAVNLENSICYWDKEILKKSFEKKYKNMLYVKADKKIVVKMKVLVQ